MIIKRHIALLTTITIFISNTVQAGSAALIDKPESCPTVRELKNLHVTLGDIIETIPGRDVCCDASGFPYHEDGTWESRPFEGKFGTHDKWKLKFPPIVAKNAKDALREFNNSLSTLTFAYGPANEFGHWYCEYNSSAKGLVAWLA